MPRRRRKPAVRLKHHRGGVTSRCLMSAVAHLGVGPRCRYDVPGFGGGIRRHPFRHRCEASGTLRCEKLRQVLGFALTAHAGGDIGSHHRLGFSQCGFSWQVAPWVKLHKVVAAKEDTPVRETDPDLRSGAARSRNAAGVRPV